MGFGSNDRRTVLDLLTERTSPTYPVRQEVTDEEDDWRTNTGEGPN